MKKFLHAASAAVLNTILPYSCASCGMLGSALCESCHTAVRQKVTLIAEQHPTPHVDLLVCLFDYDDPAIHRLVKQLKFGGQRELGAILGRIMAQHIPEGVLDLIMPVPLHQGRYNERGFNQAELLADAVSSHIEVTLDAKVLRRTIYTTPQSTHNRAERLKNLQKAFTVADPAGVLHKNILLVDDVATTLATLESCASALKQHGAQGITAFCLARSV